MAWVLPWRPAGYLFWLLGLTCLRPAQLRSRRVRLGSPWDRTIPTSVLQRTPPGSVSPKHKKNSAFVSTPGRFQRLLPSSSAHLSAVRHVDDDVGLFLKEPLVESRQVRSVVRVAAV